MEVNITSPAIRLYIPHSGIPTHSDITAASIAVTILHQIAAFTAFAFCFVVILFVVLFV